jgi:hypothetical protein
VGPFKIINKKIGAIILVQEQVARIFKITTRTLQNCWFSRFEKDNMLWRNFNPCPNEIKLFTQYLRLTSNCWLTTSSTGLYQSIRSKCHSIPNKKWDVNWQI